MGAVAQGGAALKRYHLAVVTGSGRGRRHELQSGETTIGREVVNRIVVADGLVSRRHAVVRLDGDVVEIRDVGSTNGTWVNGTRVAGPRVLRPGDTLRFGQTTLHLGAEEVEEEAAAAVVDDATAEFGPPPDVVPPVPPPLVPSPYVPEPPPIPAPVAEAFAPEMPAALAEPEPEPEFIPEPSVASGYEPPPAVPWRIPAELAPEPWAASVQAPERPEAAVSPQEALDASYVRRITVAAGALAGVIVLVTLLLLVAG